MRLVIKALNLIIRKDRKREPEKLEIEKSVKTSINSKNHYLNNKKAIKATL